MHGIGKGSTPPSAEDTEVFSSLKLVEPIERVTVRLDERMLHLEGRRTSNTVRLSSVDQTDHTSTTWIPAWTLFLGLVSIWIGYRVMMDPIWKLGFISSGTLLLVGRLLSRRPTLLIHTSQGDVQALVGGEAELYRLNFMLKRLLKFNSMTLARQAWKQHETSSLGFETDLMTPDLGLIQTPLAIETFLDELDGEVTNTAQTDEFNPEWKPTDEPEPSERFLPAFMPVHGLAHATEVAQYPPDHRPGPTHSPVLIPTHVTLPQMHQQGQPQSTGPHAYIPSFWSQKEAHIPSTPDLPDDDDLQDDDLEQTTEPDLGHVAETETLHDRLEAGLSDTQRDVPLLVPRSATSATGSRMFTKRRRTLQRRQPAAPSYRAMIREALEVGLDYMRPRQASQTSQAIRDNAQRTNIEQHDALANLETSLGREEAERLRGQFNELLQETTRLSETNGLALESMSFSELEPTTPGEDEPDLQEL